MKSLGYIHIIGKLSGYSGITRFFPPIRPYMAAKPLRKGYVYFIPKPPFSLSFVRKKAFLNLVCFQFTMIYSLTVIEFNIVDLC